MVGFDAGSFDMEGMFQNLGNIKQIMERLRETLSTKIVEASSEDGSVRVKANGNMELIDISIASDHLARTDSATLSVGLIEVSNSALRKARKLAMDEVKKLFGGIDIPMLGDLFPPGLF